MKKQPLILKQLQASLQPFSAFTRLQVPAKGWICAIRVALSMSSRQLGLRLGVSQQRAAVIETAERNGNLSIKTMRDVAEALDCEFIYGFVPRHGLEATVRKQAELIAARRLGRAVQTMRLEDQGLAGAENDEILRNMVDELVANMPKNFWDGIK